MLAYVFPFFFFPSSFFFFWCVCFSLYASAGRVEVVLLLVGRSGLRRVRRLDGCPVARAHRAAEVLQHRHELRARHAHLRRAVALPQCHGAVRLEVDRDGKGHAELVHARVLLADGRAAVIDAHREAVQHQVVPQRLHHGHELRLHHEWQDRHLLRRHQRREAEDGPLLVLRVPVAAHPVALLEEAVEDAADAEGGLDHARRVVVPGHLHVLVLEADHRGRDDDLAGAQLHGRVLARLVRGQDGLAGLRRRRVEVLHHLRRALAEGLADEALGQLALQPALDARLGVLLARTEVLLTREAVLRQVEGGAVGDADALDPAVGREQLRVPAVLCVVRHLVRLVLAEAVVAHADRLEEERHAPDEVAERLVVNRLARDGVANLEAQRLLVRGLPLARPRPHLHVPHTVEALVRLVVRVHEVFDLRQRELAHADERRARGDLVAEGTADAGAGKGHALRVARVQQALEVEDDALRQLGAQVADAVALGADVRLEHEVEGEGLAEGVALGRLDLLAHQHRLDLRGVHARRVVQQMEQRVAAVGRQVGSRELRLGPLLQEFVRADALAGDRVAHHHVVEARDVAGGLEHLLRREARRVHLAHALFQHEVLAPEGEHVALQVAHGRPHVIEARRPAVGVEGQAVEEAAAARVLELGAHEAVELRRKNSGGGHHAALESFRCGGGFGWLGGGPTGVGRRERRGKKKAQITLFLLCRRIGGGRKGEKRKKNCHAYSSSSIRVRQQENGHIQRKKKSESLIQVNRYANKKKVIRKTTTMR
ncbi:glycyl-tRNA synthetase [Strigomonas culicis]|uniref:Glycyl-tRNA synthetase n=1 Tax=Strigomonas culicis TaxID=28005 RepID=S9USG5_9TRYP|nr:glycyl-tRNA synthetase [Strigomonas culicis]|eukprot:EPY33897.1 glycyl-tRNA synthetase [Strigomonas culicis]